MDERLETQRLVLRRPGDGDLAAYRLVEGEAALVELRDAVAHWRAHGFGPWLVRTRPRSGSPRGSGCGMTRRV